MCAHRGGSVCDRGPLLETVHGVPTYPKPPGALAGRGLRAGRKLAYILSVLLERHAARSTSFLFRASRRGRGQGPRPTSRLRRGREDPRRSPMPRSPGASRGEWAPPRPARISFSSESTFLGRLLSVSYSLAVLSGRRVFLGRNGLGAEGGTRTPTGCPTRPSNGRVCQFRHFGARPKHNAIVRD